MPLPTRLVTASYTGRAGALVLFVLQNTVTDGTSIQQAGTKTTATLDGSGNLSQALLCQDASLNADPVYDWRPIFGSADWERGVVVPAGTGSVALASLSPVGTALAPTQFTQLEGLITAEQTARAAADTTEGTTRASADTAEASARASGDTAAQAAATAAAATDATNKVATETTRAQTAEALKAPLASPALTGTATINGATIEDRTHASGTYVSHVAAPTGVAATDSAAIQAAHDALPATGGLLQLTQGDYALTAGSVSLSKPVKLVGVGPGVPDGTGGTTGGTRLILNSATGVALTVAADGCVLEDFAVVNTSGTTPTAGTGVSVTHGSNGRWRNVTVCGFYNNIDYTSTSGRYWTMRDCTILDPVNFGLWIHNTTPTGDEGDMVISGCTFASYSTHPSYASAVEWNSGGGMRFENNKINQGYNGSRPINGVNINVADGVATVDMFIIGNSIEHCTTGVNIVQKGPSNTGRIGSIIIQGNEFGFSNATPFDFGVNAFPAVATVGGNAAVYGLVITGNVFFITSFAITLQNVVGATIGPNDYNGTGGTCIQLNQNNDKIHVESFGSSPKDNNTLMQDKSTSGTSVGVQQHRPSTMQREIPATTSTSTYTGLYHMTVPQQGSAVMEVTLTGNATGAGPFVVNMKRAVSRTTGAVTLTTIGTDTSTGAAAGATPGIDVLLDTATTSGDIYVKVRLTAGASTTAVNLGKCVLRYDGPLFTLKKGT